MPDQKKVETSDLNPIYRSKASMRYYGMIGEESYTTMGEDGVFDWIYTGWPYSMIEGYVNDGTFEIVEL